MSNEIKQYHSTTDMVMDHQAMNSMQVLAGMMAEGRATVPKHLQNAPSDCLAIIMQAAQWRMNPYAVAQKTHIVSGTLGYEAQLINAVIQASGAIHGRFHYEYGGNWPSGNDAWVRCGATPFGESEIQWGEPLYPSTVTTKNSPLWKTNPKQQSAYLAVKYWARLYAPGVILGVYSHDELSSESQEERDVTPQYETSALDSVVDEREKVTYKDLELLVCSAGSLNDLNLAGSDIRAALLSGDITEQEGGMLRGIYDTQSKALKKKEIDAASFEEELEAKDEVQFDK